jgi:hypothetical protein
LIQVFLTSTKPTAIEIDALPLAVGDEVGAGAELIAHCQTHCIAQCFLAVIGTK